MSSEQTCQTCGGHCSAELCCAGLGAEQQDQSARIAELEGQLAEKEQEAWKWESRCLQLEGLLISSKGLAEASREWADHKNQLYETIRSFQGIICTRNCELQEAEAALSQFVDNENYNRQLRLDIESAEQQLSEARAEIERLRKILSSSERDVCLLTTLKSVEDISHRTSLTALKKSNHDRDRYAARIITLQQQLAAAAEREKGLRVKLDGLVEVLKLARERLSHCGWCVGHSEALKDGLAAEHKYHQEIAEIHAKIDAVLTGAGKEVT